MTSKLLLFLGLMFGSLSALAAEQDAPARVAQAFCDGYLKVLNAHGNAQRFVQKSESLTPALKKAYTAFMKDPDHDPIIQAQDFPEEGFKASAATIKGDTAKVTMTSRDASDTHQFPVTLVKTADGWFISAIGSLRAKP